MEASTERVPQVPVLAHSPHQPFKTPTKNYQDPAESCDSKFKAIWDEQMEGLKNSVICYRKAFVLLLSWHTDVDDLHTHDEVTALDALFQEKFNYTTIRKTLTRDPRRTAQAQVNRYLAEFVDDNDDSNTLLIIYYAGHGMPGDSRGSLRLAGSRSLRPEYESQVHEIVWSSAEHNIKNTKGDVLVIFDCCHAGELERNVRATFARRAFEFLAATSANSTTRKPGPESFTSALIWSLSHLVDEQGTFSTQELRRTIQNDAPNFPTDQTPRLSERRPASLRKIVLAPLTNDNVSKVHEHAETEDEDDLNEEMRQDLIVRFAFNVHITEEMVKELAMELGRLIRESNVKAKDVLWEGINQSRHFRFRDSMAHFYAHRWLMNTAPGRRKNKSTAASPNEEVNLDQALLPKFVQDQGSATSSSSEGDRLIATPDVDMSISESESENSRENGPLQKNSTVEVAPGHFHDNLSTNGEGAFTTPAPTSPPKPNRGLFPSNCGCSMGIAKPVVEALKS